VTFGVLGLSAIKFARTVALAVVALSMGVAAATAGAESDNRVDVSRAIRRSMAQPALRTARTQVTPPKSEPLVEEFIAPDRLRVSLPPTNLGATVFPSQKGIVVGRSSWFLDTLAPPPTDHLFVPCPREHAPIPEVFGVMGLIKNSKQVREVKLGVVRYRVSKTSAKQLGLPAFHGDVRLSQDGLVEQLRVTAGPKVFRWDMSYGGVPPIEPPPPEQIRAGKDCEFTSVTSVTPVSGPR
jgi:hypothetical protein